MNGILARLAARAKGIPLPGGNTPKTGLRPQLPGRFEDGAASFVAPEESRVASNPSFKPADLSPEKNYPRPPAADRQAASRSPSLQYRPPPVLQAIEREPVAQPPHPTPVIAERHTFSREITEPATAVRHDPAKSQPGNDTAPQVAAARPTTFEPIDEPVSADIRPNRDARPRIQTLPERLQPLETSYQSPPGTLAPQPLNTDNTIIDLPVPIPPDVIIQIDRIDIQVEKTSVKQSQKPAKKLNLTDLSSYLSGSDGRK